ncbi:MAG: FAD-dependent oxidoreductase [Candidatus Hadarchaeum sp.]|uniref:FAD-dependent oxidoreductase n=2 Tax=Candidatus Hadarchaeum sp. TaxID=2883567 RepID=UPI003176A8A1
MRIVIVGFQSAGLTAAATARLYNREAKITVIERRSYATYHPCGLPFVIGGEVPELRDLVETAPRLQGIDVRLGVEAKAINVKEKTVEVLDLKTLQVEKIPYDKLILATGSVALRPPIPGINLGNVFSLRTIEDGEKILSALPNSRKAVVVGAGPIGVETASALKERGLDVVLIEMMPNVLPGMLDPDMAGIVAERLVKSGVRVICSKAVKELRGVERVSSVVLEGEEIPTDLVVMAIGVKPDVELAVRAGLALGPTKTIAVDDHLRTSNPDIFAIGDCAEARCLITKRPVRSQLATTAIRMGRVAGINAAGGDEIFDGVLNAVVTIAGGLEVASVGLTATVAGEAGIEAVSARVRCLNKPHYFPGAEPVMIKLVAERKGQRLLGGQFLGTGAAERANRLALAIRKEMTAKEFSKVDYCYAPPVSDSIDPMVVAAEALLRRR